MIYLAVTEPPPALLPGRAMLLPGRALLLPGRALLEKNGKDE